MNGKDDIANRTAGNQPFSASILSKGFRTRFSGGSFNPAVASLLAERQVEEASRATLEQKFSK